MELEAHLIEKLDMEAIAGLLADDNCGDEASSTLAIHVYSKLAKTHKHGVIPYLPRIMASVLTSLCCSPQLHSACAQVVAAMAAHTIDPMRDPASNEDVLRHLCSPLLSAISSSHSVHLATGAASCLKILVESERWRWCAPLDLQELVCLTGTTALTKESNHTIFHLQLMTSLMQFSSIVAIQSYGTQLLKAGMGIMQSSHHGMPIKAAAAELLQCVLKIIDAELLDLDISPILGVLQDCQQNSVGSLQTENMHVSCRTKSRSSLVKERKPSQPCVSPSQEGNFLPGMTLKHGSMACPASKFGLTSLSNESDRWLKRVPLAPLHQSSAVKGAPQNLPATYKVATQKENIAPRYSFKSYAWPKDRPRAKWASRHQSPMLWPKNVTAKLDMEKSPLFSSPHTPIVPFRKDDTMRAEDYSVNSLLEKHFGKERGCFEEQLLLSPGKGSIVDITDSGHKEAPCQKEKKGRRNESLLSCDRVTCDNSSVDSSGIDECCENDGIYSPTDGSASICETSVTSELDFNLQVQPCMSVVEDLPTTPKRLRCSRQCDHNVDDYQPGSVQGSCSESDGENSVNTGIYEDGSGETYIDEYGDNLQVAETSVVPSSRCSFLEIPNLHHATPIMDSTNTSIHRSVVYVDDDHKDEATMNSTNKSLHRSVVDVDDDNHSDGATVNSTNESIHRRGVDGGDDDDNHGDEEESTMNQHTQENLSVCFRFPKKGFFVLVILAVVCCAVFAASYIVDHPSKADMLAPT